MVYCLSRGDPEISSIMNINMGLRISVRCVVWCAYVRMHLYVYNIVYMSRVVSCACAVWCALIINRNGPRIDKTIVCFCSLDNERVPWLSFQTCRPTSLCAVWCQCVSVFGFGTGYRGAAGGRLECAGRAFAVDVCSQSISRTRAAASHFFRAFVYINT